MQIIKNLLVILLCVLPIATVSAQEEYEAEIEYEPIHGTFSPSNNIFKFEEKYDKNSSVNFIGDEMLLKSNKLNTAQASSPILINPNNDYIVEVNLTAKKLNKTSFICITVNTIALQFSDKTVMVFNLNEKVFDPSKWQLPKGSEKDKITVKFVKKRKNVTIFINDQYLTEFNVKTTKFGGYIGIHYVSSTKNEILVNSIKIEQGPTEKDDE